MNDSTIPNPEGEIPLTASASSPGQKLAARREEWDLSVEDIARTLNLGVDTVQALERDEYESLPGSTFVRGYLRTYAGMLNLDADEIVSGVGLEPEDIRDMPASRVSSRNKGQTQVRRKKKKKGRGGRRFFNLLLVLALLVAAAWAVLNLLPKLDMQEISAMLKLPVSEEETVEENEITFPAGGTESGESKGALIPIE